MIRDLDKAYLILQAPGLSLKDLAEKTRIKYQTLRLYKSNNDRLRAAAATQISDLASEWENHPTFNLLTVPWIKVLSNKTFEEETVSLTKLLTSAKEYRMLANDMKIQDVAILRLILAIVLSVYSRFDVEGKSYDWVTIKQTSMRLSRVHEEKYNEADILSTWKQLYKNKAFSKVLFDYLNKIKNDFDLFGDNPFFQVNKDIYDANVPKNKKVENGKGTVALRQLNRRIGESGNSKSIFSPKSETYKDELEFAELARWVLTYQSYTSVIDKTKVVPGDFSVSAGWTYKLNPYFVQADNIFDTLMLNLSLIDETHQYKAQRPSWEWNKEDYLAYRLKLEKPSNQAESYTLWSRMLHIELSDYGEPQLFSAGLPKMDNQEAYEEPMTIWRYSDKKATFIPDRVMQSNYYVPMFVNMNRFIDKSVDKSNHQSTIGYWIDYLYGKDLLEKEKPVNLVSISLLDDEKGSSQLLYAEKYGDVMLELNKICSDDWKKVIDTAALVARKASSILWHFVNEDTKLKGLNNPKIADKVVNEFWLNLNFQDWINDLDLSGKRENLSIWFDEVKEDVVDIAEQQVRLASAREIRGDSQNNIHTLYNALYGQLIGMLKKTAKDYSEGL
ncbi:type I-E CRISPR-associated protein Cse1/CasA [Lactobacillus sp.]|uniref:type I-E CRISPR-associated protein Cse1/CasA n=1 Tax=Lactobacillus sp. TaxID=1591 RepID=UPI0019B811A4|nr:type I-E CRISPR-associated protein Cse1/CasA [Lactobacillus sp.]MBD5430529.1 type I-E CRISPR-associated protein Cse1/CasA [Lactobacillus sp.]MBD5430821.1 type I-E CRISPR-associated protein Cse1/CasA [Lactobacillus sp.]